MECPKCKSTHVRKNGHRGKKQNHLCVDCGRQLIENPQTERGYGDEVKKICLKMVVNGMGFRGIERVTGVHHTTVMNWMKEVGNIVPDVFEPEKIPEVGELDELQTFVGSKKKI